MDEDYKEYKYRYVVIVLHIIDDLCLKSIDSITIAVGSMLAAAYDVDPVIINLPFIIVGLTIHG